MNEYQTILTTNMVLEKLRKHLTLYNFHELKNLKLEQLTSAQPEKNNQSFFSIDPIAVQEAFNANLVVVPTTTILTDAWLIKILNTFFSETLLLDLYNLRLNFLGCREDQESYNKKASKKIKNIQRIDCLCTACQREWQILRDTLHILSVSFIVDTTLPICENNATKTQFEFSAYSSGKTKKLAHGYQTITAANNNSISRAQIDIDAILNLDHKLTPPIEPALHVIVPLQQSQNSLALLIATMLHRNGKCVDVLLSTPTSKDLSDQAYKMHAKYLLLLGDEEHRSGSIIIKNLVNGTQETVKQTQIIEHLR